MGAFERHTQKIMCLNSNAKLIMRGRGMTAGYNHGLCFIPGAIVGPVPVIDTIFGYY